MYFLSAPAGSGKTYAAIRFVLDECRVRSRKYIYAGPTVELLGQIEAEINAVRQSGPGANRIRVQRFDSTTTPRVCDAIREAMEETPDGQPEILLITHEALIRLCGRSLHLPRRWHLLLDEIPTIFGSIAINLPFNSTYLADQITAVETDCPEYVRLIQGAGSRLDDIRSGSTGDDVDRTFQPVAAKLTHPHIDCEVLHAQFVRFVMPQEDTGEHGHLEMYWHLRPSVFDRFASVTIMGSNFEHSLLYLDWSRQVEFDTHHSIGKRQYRLRYTDHATVGYRLSVTSVLSARLSKTFRKTDDNEARIIAAVRQLAGDRFLLVANNDIPTSQFPGGIRLSHSPHGLNKYQHMTTCVVVSSQNPTDGFRRWLGEAKAIDADQLFEARSCETAYQFLMRSNLRDPESTTDVHLITADGEVAGFVHSLFPGSQLQFVELPPSQVEQTPRGKPGRPRSDNPSAEAIRKREYRRSRALSPAAEFRRQRQLLKQAA